MKKLLFFILLTPVLAFANPPEEATLAAISKAISEGNADALGQYFDNSVEVAVMDSEEVYAKAKAIAVVKDFFTKNKPKSFSLTDAWVVGISSPLK